MVGLPKVTFGLPNASFSQKKTFYKLLNYNKADRSPHEEGPTWLSKYFFHAVASLSSSSNEVGSKNWILISNFSAFFLMVSTLVVFSLTCSSRSCTQTAVWPISVFRVCSSMALMPCTLASSSCCLFYKISMNKSWSGNSCSLCSASTWHRL